MANNTNPCGTCDHFDPVVRGMKETQWGWCVKRSIYPKHDSRGQVTPANAVRADSAEDLAQPHMVQKTEIRSDCVLYTIAKKKPTKADLLKAAMSPKKK